MGNFFQTPRLSQTAPLVMRNLSNMFVCELLVLDSVNFYQHMLEDLLFSQNPLVEYCTGVVSDVCKSISALDKQCTKVVSYVHYVFLALKQSWFTVISRFLKSNFSGYR